jgi:nitrogen fixation protein NifZ
MDKFDMGEMVFATADLYNDDLTEDGASLIPDVEPNALLAPTGSRGVVVNVGHLPDQPQQAIYLVRFESGPDKALGVPIGCMQEELTNSG